MTNCNKVNDSACLRRDFEYISWWEAQWDMDLLPEFGSTIQRLHQKQTALKESTTSVTNVSYMYIMHNQTLESVSPATYLAVDLPGSEIIKLVSCSTQPSMKFVLLINLRLLTIANAFLLNIAKHEYFSANRYKNARWHFVFISRENFMLS